MMHGPDDGDGPVERIRAALDIVWQSPTGARALCGSCGKEIDACLRMTGCPDWSRVARAVERRQIDLTRNVDARPFPMVDEVAPHYLGQPIPQGNRHERRAARAIARRARAR